MALRKVVHWGGLFGDQVLAVECPAKGIVLQPCDQWRADRIVEAWHYSGTSCQNTAISLLVYWNGEISGALQLGYGIRPDKNGGRDDETREFDRMCLADAMPKFSESIVLGLLHLYLRKAHPEVARIVSYADTSVGNWGTIYQAANYRRIGEIPVDFYVLADGTRVHPVTMWHRHGTRAWATMQELYPGIRWLRKEGAVHVKYEFSLR